jgi:hypothetical protein
MGVVSHVKETGETDTPGVFLGVFAPEDGDALVDGAGEVGIVASAEDGAGAGVGIQPGEVLGAKGEGAVGVLRLLGPGSKEEELSRVRRTPPPQNENAELVGAVDAWEKSLAVFKVQEGGELALIDDGSEEVLIRVVGGDAGGEDEA